MIRDTFNLTDAQIEAALSYIQANQVQVEAEYQEVLQNREEIHQYWEERNRERFAQIAEMPRKPRQEVWMGGGDAMTTFSLSGYGGV